MVIVGNHDTYDAAGIVTIQATFSMVTHLTPKCIQGSFRVAADLNGNCSFGGSVVGCHRGALLWRFLDFLSRYCVPPDASRPTTSTQTHTTTAEDISLRDWFYL